jgi:hypothetical protein
MKVVTTIRQTENGKYFCWEGGTEIQANYEGKKVKRKVFVFFDKGCSKPTSTPVKISVLDGFRSFYQWTSKEGNIVTCSTMYILNYEVVEEINTRNDKKLKEKITGIDSKNLFTSANGVVPF